MTLPTPVTPVARRFSWRDVAIGLALIAGVALIYGQTYAFDFVNYDDNDYVYENLEVRRGLSWHAIRWAFTTGHAANWHPLTWISHLVDVQLFGLWAGGHHLVAAGFHAADAVLLFVLLRTMTARVWPSAFVAALFAWHPLRAESVAWVAERKDVLSTFFALLSLIAYAAHVRRSRAGGHYVAMLIALACSLMSKGMFVTMPFVLLLLDVWPLRRIDPFDGVYRRRALRPLLLEKLPVFGVVFLAALATYTFQSDAGAVMAKGQLSAAPRLMNAVVSVVRYLRMTVAPYGLASYYPHPYNGHGGSLSLARVVGSAMLIAILSAVALWRARVQPYLAVGWFWFLGTLVPVIGLVQVGDQALADRYTYVPGIGLAIAVVWTIADLARVRSLRPPLVGAGAIAVVAYGVLAHRQVGFWRDSVTLMRRGADVVPDSFIAHLNLGTALDALDDRVGAETEYRRALAIYPDDPAAMTNLANLMLNTGRPDEARACVDAAIARDPHFAAAYDVRAALHLGRHERAEAFADYERALSLRPNERRISNNYAFALALAGRYDEAERHWRDALALDPDYPVALGGYGRALLVTGDTNEAYRALRRAIALDPGDDQTRYVLAWSLATNASPAFRAPREAIALVEPAWHRAPREPLYADALAAAWAADGRFDAAAALGDRAAELADAAGNAPLAADVRARVVLYRSGKPYVSSR